MTRQTWCRREYELRPGLDRRADASKRGGSFALQPSSAPSCGQAMKMLTLKQDLSQVAVDRSVTGCSGASLCRPSARLRSADYRYRSEEWVLREDSVGERLAPGPGRTSESDELENLRCGERGVSFASSKRLASPGAAFLIGHSGKHSSALRTRASSIANAIEVKTSEATCDVDEIGRQIGRASCRERVS